MSQQLMGKKRGMTQVFDEQGNLIACTVIEVEPNVVTQIKTVETDGYTAVQTGFDKIKGKRQETIDKRAGKPMLGHFKKSGAAPRRSLVETRTDNTDQYTLGQEIGVDVYDDIKYVDVTAVSIGKGYQGVMKLHNFAGCPASHGTGPIHRSVGSTGNRSTPGRCFPGGERASHMGHRQVTVQSLKIIQIDKDENIIVVKGAVPGPKNCLVTMKPAVKKIGFNKKGAK